MKPAARNVRLLFLLSLLLPAAWLLAAPAPRLVRDLLAHGTDRYFWCADVVPVTGTEPGTRTTIRYRGAGDSQWKRIGEFAEPAKSLSNRGAELLVVLEGGDWKLISESGVRSGTTLPGGAEVLALAGDGDDIWAVGAAAGGGTLPLPATTTSPSTTRGATRPTTSPLAVPHELGLFLLSRGDWQEVDRLPPSLRRRDIQAISMAVIDRRLMLAVAGGDRAIRIFTRTADGWVGGEDLATLGDRGRIKLLDPQGRPALWVAEAAGPGTLYLGGAKWGPAVKLQNSQKLTAFDRTALASALGQIRLLATDGKGRLAEQIYELDGQLSGQTTEAVTATGPSDTRVVQTVQLILVAVMFIWMMGTLRTQRAGLQDALRRADQLNLASLLRRAVGGVIDALPILMGVYLAERASAGAATPLAGRLTYESPELAWMAAGFGVYLLHTTLCELLLARSVGKLITGTRVATLEGKRPTSTSLLIRNALRLVDIFLVFPPIFVFFSPLRQRIGDMAAATIVVRDGTPIVDPIDPPEGAT